MRFYWLFGALFLSLALSALNFIALENFWYWRYAWFDIPMHMLGGLTLGTFFVGFSPRPRPASYVIAMAILFVGWEVIEYVGGITQHEANYVFDTAHDLLNDTLGAAAAYVLARFTIWRSK